MAIVKCKECGNEVSDKADVCVHCGCPLEIVKTCSECGNSLGADDNVCTNCGNLVNKMPDVPSVPKKGNKKATPAIFGGVALVIVIVVIIILTLSSSKGNTLVCKYEISNSVGSLSYEITYTFEDGKIKTLEGYQYAKPNSTISANNLWNSTSNAQNVFQGFDGFDFKAKRSGNEIKMYYTLDVEKAGFLLESVAGLASVDNIKLSSTRDQIKEEYEENKFTCK